LNPKPETLNPQALVIPPEIGRLQPRTPVLSPGISPGMFVAPHRPITPPAAFFGRHAAIVAGTSPAGGTPPAAYFSGRWVCLG